MGSECPYCGEGQRALKNHVRLAAGDGHGPSGQYPDDFDLPEEEEEGTATTEEAASDTSDGVDEDQPANADAPAVEEVTETADTAPASANVDDGAEIDSGPDKEEIDQGTSTAAVESDEPDEMRQTATQQTGPGEPGGGVEEATPEEAAVENTAVAASDAETNESEDDQEASADNSSEESGSALGALLLVGGLIVLAIKHGNLNLRELRQQQRDDETTVEIV